MSKKDTFSNLPLVFNSMSASYKAYWMIGLVECFIEEKQDQIPIRNICSRMLVNSWYPIHFFRLKFGLQDLISQNNINIKEYLNLKADIKKNELLDLLYNTTDSKIINWIMHFKRQVPFRFLSPWIKYKSDAQVISDSQMFKNEAPYAINRSNNTIDINPIWKEFLSINSKILIDYGYWNLLQYLQSKNPGVPSLQSKLIKPAVRESLNKQRDYWNLVFDSVGSIRCIYSNQILTADDFAVEHYIPWSFTAHNLLWNLIPADQSINSSKSNKLPNTEEYLRQFVTLQRLGLNAVYQKNKKHKLFEDYSIFGESIPNLLNLSNEKLYELYENQISPQIILANQLGFQYWSPHTNESSNGY